MHSTQLTKISSAVSSKCMTSFSVKEQSKYFCLVLQDVNVADRSSVYCPSTTILEDVVVDLLLELLQFFFGKVLLQCY